MLAQLLPHRYKIFATLALIIALILPSTGLAELSHLNDAQTKTVAILLLAAVLWVTEWVPLFVVSFIILALELIWLMPSVQALDIAASDSLFFSPFFSNIILLFMGGFVLSSIMQKAALDSRLAFWILKLTKGEPKITLLGIIAGCIFLSMWMSNTATAAMMLTMILPLTKQLRFDSPFRVGLILAIPLSCNLGGMGTPIGTPPNAIAMSYLTAKGIDVSFLEWIILTMPFLLITAGVLWLGILKVYPPGNDVLEMSEAKIEPFRARQWFTLFIFVFTVIGWLIGGQFGLKTGTIALFPIIASFWLGLLDQSDFRALPWDVLFMVSGGIALGVAIDISDLGQVILSFLPATGSFEMLVALMVMVGAVLGTVMSNTATAGLLIPIVVSLALPTNQLLVMVLAITLNCSTAMILPISTPPNAIAFGSGMIGVKDIARMGILMNVLGIILAITIGPIYWFLVL
ncbi:SLC13 family permease [Reinekea marinisedimentorum]|uniref:Sodium-dependent dicarboxylate transporter 2/3/5 n=1 Tax=Reinekea marinisedimentorum TaxID=230495 RepID=A0A4R3I849_9GAMM|nr:DASS family sodium-coupled anion symporter [Reinekea marinisedimentorum]TCS40347.1 sodium-dependent dicarboxylate transporter 2/3/5 [Reinekea marinisedimentorum]